MTEPHERLKEARVRARYAEAADAARAFGWNEVTYRSHENGQRGLRPDVAKKYARAFRVSMAWLLTGSGSANSTDFTTVSLVGSISAGGTISLAADQSNDVDAYEAALMATIPGATMAFQIVGTSMLPVYQPDSLIVCGEKRRDLRNLVGDVVAVCTAGGDRFLKIIHAGSRADRWHLESTNAPIMLDVEVAWAAEIVAIIPAKQWNKIERTPSRAKQIAAGPKRSIR